MTLSNFISAEDAASKLQGVIIDLAYVSIGYGCTSELTKQHTCEQLVTILKQIQGLLRGMEDYSGMSEEEKSCAIVEQWFLHDSIIEIEKEVATYDSARLEFDPGPVAVTVAMNAIKGLLNVKELNFITNGAVVCMDGRDSRGRWDIPTGTITIDIAECIRQLDWVRKLGMFVTYNIWYNVLYAIFHESIHAWQCLQEGWTEKLPADANIDLLEQEAHEKALDLVFEWFNKNSLPNLNNMADLGVEIKRLRNSMYASDPHIEAEQKVWGTDAAAKAETFAILNPESDGGDSECLFDRIDEGSFGCIIGGVRYLKATDLVASQISIHF